MLIKWSSYIGILFLLYSCYWTETQSTKSENDRAAFKLVEDTRILTYIVNPRQQCLRFYWKNEQGNNYGSFEKLKTQLAQKNEAFVFATNGGMYNKDLSPQGLFIENSKTKIKLDKKEKGYGNFYMQPNGIFYLTQDNKAAVCTVPKFQYKNVQYATQSGPMLVIDGALHPKFNEGSPNIHIRNGVGVLPNGDLLFAMSKEKINFYDFASFFQKNACENALYLDGFVSRTYLPSEDWIQLDGNFGVIIAESKSLKFDD